MAYKAKETTDVPSKSKKELESSPSPEQLEIVSVKEFNGQVMIEFRTPSTSAPSIAGTDYGFGATNISVQSIPTTDAEPHNYQTVDSGSTAIKFEDEVDIKIEDEMEFCALNQSIPETEFAKIEDEMEFCDEVEKNADKPGESKGNKNNSEFICDICSKEYSSKFGLANHRVRHGKPNFGCTVCGVTKFTQYEINRHMRTHDTNPIYFQCDICPKKYSIKSRLNKHRRLRHGKSNEIKFCNKVKKDAKKLEKLKRKRRKSEFICDICSKDFASKANLSDHRKRHDTNNLPFKCDICPKKFLRKTHFKEHRVRHGKPNFHCDICGVAKFTQRDMNGHMKRHNTNRT